MPSSSIETLGRLISRQVTRHPDRTRALLHTAYTLVGVQMKCLPPKNVLPARCAMQGDTTRSMATALGHSGRATCVDIFFPCEMFHALDISPTLPEGLPCYLVSTTAERVFVETVEERGVSENYCPYHKILPGLAETGIMAKLRFILNTSLACDVNQLTFRRLAGLWGVPRFTVDVSYTPSRESVTQVIEQPRVMAIFVWAHEGRPLEEGMLWTTVARSRATVKGYRRYLALQTERSLFDEVTSEMLFIFATRFMLGSPEALRYVERLCAQVVALPEGRHGRRVLWLHTSPH